jgi:hypothetical protein
MIKTKTALLIALFSISLVISIGLLVHVCPGGKLYDDILNQCVFGSTGWKITGYFIPLENDYLNDSSLSVYVKGKNGDPVDYVENDTKYYLKKFSNQFISEVNTEGSGKTRDDKILQTWVDDYIYPNQIKTRFYHYESCPRTSSGICLPVVSNSFDAPLVMVAVTKGTTDLSSGIIEQGMMFHIPDIANPWNSKTFWAVDVGEWHDKHIDVYTGYGLKAREEAKRITKLPPNESGTVLIIGFKPTNETK